MHFTFRSCEVRALKAEFSSSVLHVKDVNLKAHFILCCAQFSVDVFIFAKHLILFIVPLMQEKQLNVAVYLKKYFIYQIYIQHRKISGNMPRDILSLELKLCFLLIQRD